MLVLCVSLIQHDNVTHGVCRDTSEIFPVVEDYLGVSIIRRDNSRIFTTAMKGFVQVIIKTCALCQKLHTSVFTISFSVHGMYSQHLLGNMK